MIWINFFILLNIEIWLHRKFIKKGTDPTPDRKWSWLKGAVMLFRVVVFVLPVLIELPMYRILLVFYIIGSLFYHWLYFSPVLNLVTGKKASHLGDGFFDRALDWIFRGHFVGRIFSLGVVSAGMIYGYFHPELYDNSLNFIRYVIGK